MDKKKRTLSLGAKIGIVFGVLLIIGMVTSGSHPDKGDGDVFKAPVQASPKLSESEVYDRVVAAARSGDYQSLKSALDTAEANHMTSITTQAREAGYYAWLLKNKPQTPLEKATETIEDLKKTNLIKGYDSEKRVYLVNGPVWAEFPVPYKELVVNVMSVVVAQGNRTFKPSFEVREFHSNDLLASYSATSGAKIGAN